MPTSQDLRRHQPLAGRAPRERRALYGGSGMHSPNEDMRTDADAFEIRGDVTVEDACLTALRLMRASIAQLELLGMTPELAPAYRDAVEGIACLCRLTGGSIGLVHAALCDEPPPGQGT